MSIKLPYMVTPGVIPKVLNKIREARRTERFTQDYLETMLGIRGGNGRAIIPLLKRMQFLNGDGTPTSLYDSYRNDDTQAWALAQGVRNAYDEIFDRNQFAFALPREKFASLVHELTGQAKDSSVAKAVVSTFFVLKGGADFEAKPGESRGFTDAQGSGAEESQPTAVQGSDPTPPVNVSKQHYPPPPPSPQQPDGLEFRVGYTINLNLPETTNPDVFNAIFKSLKEHLLRN